MVRRTERIHLWIQLTGFDIDIGLGNLVWKMPAGLNNKREIPVVHYTYSKLYITNLTQV